MNNLNPILQLRFVGDHISPGSFSAKELGHLLIDIQKSVLSIAGITEDSDENSLISLKEITNESAGLHFYSDQQSVNEASIRLINAVGKRDFTGLPLRSFEGIKHISKLAKEKKCDAELKNRTMNTTAIATLKESDNLIFPEDVLLKDTKDFYGEITRVGGVEPRVQFKTFSGTTHHADVSKELARQIANKLYQTVKMKAEVQWIASSDGFEEIKIVDIEDYKVQTNAGLFDELRETLGSYSDRYGSDLEGVIND
ncbi:MAG: hypothetical protein ACQERO_14500 [Bacteroidota bacterium]